VGSLVPRALVAAIVFLLLVALGAPAAARAASPGSNGKIAFVSTRDDPNGEIYVMNADGSGVTRLTSDPGLDADPTWSPDGTQIAWAAERAGNVDIYVMDADGSNPRRITTNAAADTLPTWSPDGTRIAFTTNRADSSANALDIYSIAADGTGSETPLAATAGIQESSPRWAPDGSKILYNRHVFGTSSTNELYTMNPDGSGQALLPPSAIAQGIQRQAPADWSPDSSTVVYQGDHPGSGFAIYAIAADGTTSSPSQLTPNAPPSNKDPAFSPDGSKIAFTSDRDGNEEIYSMSADGSGQTRLTSDPARDFDPDWQPLRLFAYAANAGSNDVSVVDLAADAVVATIPVGATPLRIVVAPDGRRAYVTNGGSNSVSVIDTALRQVVKTIPVGTQPVGLAVTPDGHALYVANAISHDLSRIALTGPFADSVVDTFPVGGSAPTQSIAFSPNGHELLVGGGCSNCVTKFNYASDASVGTIAPLATIGGVIGAADRIGYQSSEAAYVNNGCGDCGNLERISTSTNAVECQIGFGRPGQGLAIAGDGSAVYAGTQAGPVVDHIDPGSCSVTGSVPLPAGMSPGGLALSPDGRLLFVTVIGASGPGPDDLRVFDTTTLTEVGQPLHLGSGPVDVAIGAAAPAPAPPPPPPPSTTVYYLHANGMTLTLDPSAPTATTPKYADSASVSFAGGNPWKAIGTWSAVPSASSRTLLSLSDLHAWLGLRSSDDQGTQFDLRAEVARNGVPVGSSTTRCITGVTRNPDLAKEVTAAFDAFAPVPVAAGDVVSLKLSTRIGTNSDGSKCSGHASAIGLRTYFDAVSRAARFSATFQP
jgi:YVTN family beta-propeller protein